MRPYGESFAVGGSNCHEFSHGGAEFRLPSCDADRNSPPCVQDSSACRDGGNGTARPASGHQAHQLINRERHNPEHQMTQHLGMAAHAHAATSEFILEATIDALDGRAFVGNVSPQTGPTHRHAVPASPAAAPACARRCGG